MILMMTLASLSLAVDGKELFEASKPSLELMIRGDVQTAGSSIQQSSGERPNEGATLSGNFDSEKFSESAMEELIGNVITDPIDSDIFENSHLSWNLKDKAPLKVPINGDALEDSHNPRKILEKDEQDFELLSNQPRYLKDAWTEGEKARNEINMNLGYLYERAFKENALNANENALQQEVSLSLHKVNDGYKSGDIIRPISHDLTAKKTIGNYYYEKNSGTEISSPFSNSDDITPYINYASKNVYTSQEGEFALNERTNTIKSDVVSLTQAQPSETEIFFSNSDDITPCIDYVSKNVYTSQEGEFALNEKTGTIKSKVASHALAQPSWPLLETTSNLKYIYDTSTAEPGKTVHLGVDIFNIKKGINSDLKQLTMDNANDVINPNSEVTGLLNLDTKSTIEGMDIMVPSPKNYAVVIGINNYTDRSSLHTSINDANTVASILESYSYNVVKLTDQTPVKPTKENILDKTLSELKYKKDIGNILIYFSGHGEKDGDQYYLIPQDGNGQISSYISAKELQSQIKGLKNVAIVVDACNSGELECVVEKGQLMLVSSEKDQPSNEIWLGSLSLFTYSLCNALKEEESSSEIVTLERCFYKARKATESWSRWRLLAQTPQIDDKTDGSFIIKKRDF
jgi:hypothetical protein